MLLLNNYYMKFCLFLPEELCQNISSLFRSTNSLF